LNHPLLSELQCIEVKQRGTYQLPWKAIYAAVPLALNLTPRGAV
jgi:hypothetical protein